MTVHEPVLAPPARPERGVHFPMERGLGELLGRPQGTHRGALSSSPWEQLGIWQRVGRARTDVTLPAGTDVLLDLSPAAVVDLVELTTLQPDDLQVLDLSDTPLRDADLRHVVHLTGLQALHLGGTGVGDAAVDAVLGLGGLEELSLAGTRVSDAGLAGLAQLPRLRDLDLADTGITDAGVARLGRLTQLRRLRLTNTAVTDAGLLPLLHLHLRHLDLCGTQVSFLGLVRLKQVLTGCMITRLG